MKKRYCDNGCPYGQSGVLCLLSRQLSCPIDQMYQNILVYQSGETRCAWCSRASDKSPSSRWPAQGHCGQCPQFCPACEAPRNEDKT